ncbi:MULTISPECIES: hypothetical protein [Paenibacillus]|uniref:Uncharacterized protein n=1 Tax=Paenibacillus vulneris TaxID=1133364 RepID=A0ABW3ULW5_9BACL|nr:hypothetical protein [Paenibacillus sp. 32352]
MRKLIIGIAWIGLTVIYFFGYGIVNTVLDINENGFGPMNLTICLLPFVVGLLITYMLTHLLEIRHWHKPLWIFLSIILAVPATLSLIKLFDQQMNAVDLNQHKTLEEQFRAYSLTAQSNGETAPLYVRELTDFVWDKLYLFGPYTTHTQINERLGYEWTKNTLRLSDESSSLLVFVHDGKVVQYLDISLWIQGDPDATFTPEGAVLRSSKIFTNDNQSNQTTLQLIET